MSDLPKLTRADWIARVTDAQKEEVRARWVERAERFQKYYEGQATAPTATEHVVVNTVFKDVKTSIPKVFAKNPDILCRPAQPGEEANTLASYGNRLLLYYFRELGIKRTINRALLDTKLSGEGVVKFGWSFETAEQEISPDAFDHLSEVTKERVTQVMETKTKPARFIQQVILQDEPWVLRWNPKDVVVDPEATSPDLSDARWVALRKILHRHEAESLFGTFKGAQTFKVKTSRRDRQDAKANEDFHRLTLWEIFDKLRQERLLLFEEVEAFEKREAWEFEVDGFPLETIFFNETPDVPYGDPDVRFYEGQLREKNDIRTSQVEHRRGFNPQMLYEEDALEDTQVANATKNVSHSWVKMHPGGVGKIQPRPTPQLPADLYATEQRIDVDLAEIIGSEAQRGSQPLVEKTATEAAIIESRTRSRDAERQDAVEGFLHRVASKLWVVLRQKLPRARVEEILGEPAPFWKNVTGVEAKKELIIDIQTNSTLPRFDRAVMVSQDIQLLNILSTMQQPLLAQGQRVNVKPLLDEILTLLNHKVTAQEIIQPAPVPSTPGLAPAGQVPSPPPASNLTSVERLIQQVGGERRVPF